LNKYTEYSTVVRHFTYSYNHLGSRVRVRAQHGDEVISNPATSPCFASK